MTLLPYWYTAFWQQAQDGTPVLTSLVAADPSNPQTHHRENEFLVGSHLLVAPVVEHGRRAQRAYLPQGPWYAWEDSQTFAGREEHPVAAPLHRIPLFVRAGACIPRYPVQQHVHERPVEELVLDVYGPADGITVRSQGYFDAGDGVPEPGNPLPHELRTWTTEAHASNGWTLHQECSNHSFASFSSVRLRVFGGSPDTPPSAVCDGLPVHFVRSAAAWVSEPRTDALDPTETGISNDGSVWTAELPSRFTRVDFSA
jgi:alpha-glucosidase